MFWKKHKPKKAAENPDPTPVAMPVKFHRPPTLQEQIRAYTRASLNRHAEAEGKETFEEANDFDVGDDDFPRSQHELEFDARGEAEFEQFATKALRKSKKPVATDAGTPAPDASGKNLQPTAPSTAPQSTLP